jgi:DNA-directed RNA polymerase specialized sigma24 family protein
MSTTSITTPTGPSSDGSTTPHVVFLAFGLVAFAVLWALPVAVLVWLSGMFFGSVGIAEMLEGTRGLAPTTYGGAFWLAVVITLAMVALEVRTLIRGAPEGRSWLLRFITRPSTAYFVLIMPTVLLVRLDTRGTDVPDILTTTLLLCCLGYVWFVLPLGMAAVAWRLTWWLWRKGTSSGFAAGVLGTLGLSFAMCTPVVCVANDEDEPFQPVERVTEAFGRGFDRAKGQDAIDGSRTLMSSLAEVSESEPKALAPAPEVVKDDRNGFPFFGGSKATQQTDAELFEECIEEIFRGGTTSIRGMFLSSLVSRHSLDRAVAEDIVQDAALELCLRHARVGSEPYEKLATIFAKKVDSRLKNWYRYQDVRNRCVMSVVGYYEPQEQSIEELMDFGRAYHCALAEEDRRILKLSTDGHDARSIGAPAGLSAEAVGQRKSRAIRTVRDLLQRP